MIGCWLFWRVVETLILYLIFSIFTDPPQTLGLSIVTEFVLIIIYSIRYLSGAEEGLKEEE